ncbi:MAG: EAL domain-containing protein [Campylobacterota bacterium]|nr:EAL domain-containing protein [Campylobacterota bacterium]
MIIPLHNNNRRTYHDNVEKALIQSIINIGKNFGMKTLAEGVESLEQVEALKMAKCDIFQGYYYSKPLVKSDLVEFIKRMKVD